MLLVIIQEQAITKSFKKELAYLPSQTKSLHISHSLGAFIPLGLQLWVILQEEVISLVYWSPCYLCLEFQPSTFQVSFPPPPLLNFISSLKQFGLSSLPYPKQNIVC